MLAPRPPAHRVAVHPADQAVPAYLQDTYWWAYLHPRAVRVFERQWLVNLILWGHFARLRNAALDALLAPAAPDSPTPGAVARQLLQVACVYGNFTPELVKRLPPNSHLTVVDVAPIQLENLARKLGDTCDATVTATVTQVAGSSAESFPTHSAATGRPTVQLACEDAAALTLASGSQDAVVLFFLLHEQPADVRQRTLAEAWRVLRPGGKLVVVDYHRPVWWHPVRAVMLPVLHGLEPFAMDLWREEVLAWLPPGARVCGAHKRTWFGGLYQQVVAYKGLRSGPDQVVEG